MITDQNNTSRSPSSRVSIDGGRIKYLRESKGFTQLYIATFLGVTPDTVSRWENRKYPTVKWENVTKLAEALQVDVSEILDTGQEESGEPEKTITTGKRSFAGSHRITSAIILVSMIFLCIAGYFILQTINKRNVTIRATRFLPKHIPAGQKFPVVIRVESNNNQPFSFIFQERLPENYVILKGLPEIASQDPKQNTFKWICNAPKTPFYLAYLVQAASPEKTPAGSLLFTGEIKADRALGVKQMVSGDSKLELSDYHWADSNSDGKIDDDEILLVFSSADVLKRIGVDLESIKNIWSVGGYEWNPVTHEYSISLDKEGDQ